MPDKDGLQDQWQRWIRDEGCDVSYQHVLELNRMDKAREVSSSVNIC